MKVILFLICVFFALSSAFSQSLITVKGTIKDPATNTALETASICILNSKDSILYKYAASDSNGEFAVNGLSKGSYLLLVSYPDYTDYVENFSVDSNPVINVGKISLIRKSVLLNEVVIKGRRTAIRIKGDTTEYNASSFIIQPNDRVEDLLIQFPGIEVDKDGRIKAQGQAVNKILVDGAEFFSEDPTLVTKNIRADMVDKIQLYDKRSDQAELTGVDDGKKTKTLNVVLREDKKKGAFGKVEGGEGSGSLYQSQIMFNSFKDKQKWSVYAVAANTGKVGVGGFESYRYGVLSGTNDLDYFDGKYRSEGIPTARDAGIHYDNKWNSERQSLNINYKIGSLNVDGSKELLVQNNITTGAFTNNSNSTFDNHAFRQKIDGAYQLKLSSTSSIKITLDGVLKNSTAKNVYENSAIRTDNILLNTNNRLVSSNVDSKIFQSTAFWTKELKKKGRTLSISLGETINNRDANGYLDSKSIYFNSQGISAEIEEINQFKINNIRTSVLNGNITYSEPLSEYLKAVFTYNTGVSNVSSDRKSYNRSFDNFYNLLDSSYSNSFNVKQFSNGAGFIFNYNKKKTNLNLTGNLAVVKHQHLDKFSFNSFNRTFNNWNPEISYTFTRSQNNYVNLKYSGNTLLPSLDQLQPIQINIDPLNIIIGNPSIKPSFVNELNVIYSNYKMLNDRYISFAAAYSSTSLPITTDIRTDSYGKSTYQSVNFRDRNSTGYKLNSYFGQKIKSIETIVGLKLNFNSYRTFNYVNDSQNKTNSAFYSAVLNLSKGALKKFNINGNFGPNYTVNKSSLQIVNNDGFGFSGDLTSNLFLPAKLKIRTESTYQYRAGTSFFNDDFSQFILNSSLSKSFMKNNTFILSITGYDLLNQNKGFYRTVTENRVEQSSYTNVNRYFLLSIVWDFNKVNNSSQK